MRRTVHRSHLERQGPEPGFIPALVFGDEVLLDLFDANVADYVLHLVVGAAAAYLGFAPVRRSPHLPYPLEPGCRGRGRSLYTPATLFASRIISALA
jgi:hypothetical protein